ncbi:ELF3-like protein 2 isoform X1 [Senna tora]|uniref:ELF3-like protein 2 isoform X1 n=1 Tax=Senna tora TaxID=362788 RepID=A0A834XDL9_9FABA|nr:ELF3-like protein 2 isoform X1 [Senna tora]
MKRGIEEVKEMSPMFPRLHIKDAEKGGPKAPPRNKMALYEQFTIPSQNFASGSPSRFPPLFRSNCSVSPTSGLVNPMIIEWYFSAFKVEENVCTSSKLEVGSGKGIQYSTSSVSSYVTDKIHAYHSRSVNLTKLMPDGFINCNNSLKKYEHEDALITPVSAHGRNSCCSISKNKQDEDTHTYCKPSCSPRRQNSFSKKVSSTAPMQLKSAGYGKNQIEDNTKVNQIDQKPEEGSAYPIAGFGDIADESSITSVKVRTPKPMKKAHASLMEEFRSISVENLKIQQSSNGQTDGEDGYLEKPELSDVHKCPDGVEIDRKCLWGKRDRNRSEDMYRHYDALNKPIPDSSIIGMGITPDDVLGVIGEMQFWKARRTIINQQRIFVMQLFELHRLIKNPHVRQWGLNFGHYKYMHYMVQKLIAGSPNLLFEDNPLLNQPSLKVSAPKKLHSDYVIQQPFSNTKLNNSKSEKPNAAECAESTSLEKIPLPCVNNNKSKGLSDQLSNYGHHSGNHQLPTTTGTKPSPCYIYPAPGNQWLVPYMSPSEGLIYKPFVGPCPPNAGFMGPVYGACSPISLTPGNKDVSDATHVPYIFPPCGPPIMHPSMSVFSHEQMSPPTKMQLNGIENHQSAGDVNSAILYQSSSNMSSQMSQVMSRHVTNNNHPSEDKELQTSTGSSPSKRTGDALPLFPMAPTFWASSDHHKAQAVDEHEPLIIKVIPHNPKSTTESAARIFRSIQEERKQL